MVRAAASWSGRSGRPGRPRAVPATIPAPTDLGRRADDLGLHGHEVAKLGAVDPQPQRSPGAIDAALNGAARGDAEAFAELYDLCSSNVYGLIRRILRNVAQSDEVLQEVMLEVWRLAPRFDATLGSASAWIMTIAHRRAVDRVRSEVAERGRVERASSRADVSGAPVDDDVIDELDRQRVRVALDRLTDLQRSSIELAYFGGLTHTEIAAYLDVPLGTVKTRIRDGLIRLRDELGEGS